MNSNTTFLIAGILAFALLANVSAPVFATGGLDDEEEEEAIEQLQNAVDEIQNTLGTIQLNLTQGANDITANCPEVAEEENTTTVIPPEPPTQCPFNPPPAVIPIEENVTEVIEEIIENVTQCPFNPPPPTIIPGIVLPNITEPVEPQCPPQEPPIVVEPVVPECPLPPVTNTTEVNNENNLTDGQEIAEIEFDTQCSCFVVDKTPESVEQALSDLGN